MSAELSDREKTVLRYVVHDFIETAIPIGSRYISKRHEDVIGLSSATIRNVMSDLEYMGYIDHPHTSAGRIPTDLGYRFYVDSLMDLENVSVQEEEEIRRNLDSADTEEIFRESSRILGKISRQLCVVTSPHLTTGVFEKLELVQISSNRIMVVISLKLGLVRTIMMEVASEIPRERLEELGRFLNERLGGLTLGQIRESFAERMKDAQNEPTGLIRLFIDSVDKLFIPSKKDKLHFGGTEGLVDQPEFIEPQNFRSVIELINNEEIIIHVLEKCGTKPHKVTVKVGEENEDTKLRDYGVVTSTYVVGDVVGSIGVIGPRRMPYSRMVPLVDYVARTISNLLSYPNRT